MNITTVLKEDHDSIRKLLEECESLDDGAREQKRGLVDRIAREQRVHTELEQEFFYREIERAGPADAARKVQEAIAQHQEVEEILEQLVAMSPDADGYDGLVTDLRESIEHHVQEEETDLFDLAKQLPEEHLEALGDQMEARRADTQREIAQELRAEHEAAEGRSGAILEED